MSAGAASSSAAAMRLAFSSTFSMDAAMAGPPTDIERLPNVPTPAATTAVSLWRTVTSSIGTPRRPAVIWSKAVSSPWPLGARPRDDRDLAGRLHAHAAALPSDDVRGLRRADAGGF